MGDLAADEVLVLFLSGIATVTLFLHLLLDLGRPTRLGEVPGRRGLLMVAGSVGLSLIFHALRHWSALAPSNQWARVSMFLLIGAVLIAGVLWVSSRFGISPRVDAVERRNDAALLALCGAMLGISLCYAGCIAAGGPALRWTLLRTVVSLVVYLGAWALVQKAYGWCEAITIERDLASGLRLGGILIGIGLLIGFTAATPLGSLADMTRQVAWRIFPAAVLVAISVLFQRWLRPTRRHPDPGAVLSGLLPAALYIAFPILVVRFW